MNKSGELPNSALKSAAARARRRLTQRWVRWIGARRGGARRGAGMMRRQTFVRLVVVLFLAAVVVSDHSFAMAQPADKPFRIGAVSAGAGRSSPHWRAFDQRLVELGYVETNAVEFRNAEGKPERLPGLMNGLVRSGVDLIFAPGPEAALRAVQASTTTIPIVIVAIDYDPIAHGYVSSLARPGGNTTGLFRRQLELTAKRIELLKEMGPNLRQVVAFWDSFSGDQLKEAESAARSAGLRLQRDRVS